MDISSWREVAYNNKFDSTVKFIHNMKNNDPTFTIKELEGMLQSEYDREGLAWDGRGEVVEIAIQATIAAMQQEILNWRKEISAKLELP
ncbi:MAG: hypothetical protein IH598_07635 [Bacteroidales bacterium]|nr:hypothetical protein [Bacteroidales bacterium]